jgi:hypothetical protein
MNEPVLNAARKVVIKLAQTKIELPKNGASTRDATSCSPMLSMPRQKTRRKSNACTSTAVMNSPDRIVRLFFLTKSFVKVRYEKLS